MKALLAQQGFLALLTIALAGGIAFARPLQPISEWAWLRDGIVAAVMFSLALSLEARTIIQRLRHPGAPLLATSINFALLPLCAWGIARLLPGDLGAGLQVAAATPCTLASAAVWTRRAGGNDTVATIVTVVTNGSCFLVTPLWLSIMLGTPADHSAPELRGMTGQLAGLVALPLCAAQAVRRSPQVRTWAEHHRATLGGAAQGGILAMIFLGAIRTGLKLQEQSGPVVVADLSVMAAAVLALHLAMFWLGMRLGRCCGFPHSDQIAIGFSGSQKTLMVGILLAMSLKVTILPMVAYHCLQLVADTLIADRLRMRGAALEQRPT